MDPQDYTILLKDTIIGRNWFKTANKYIRPYHECQQVALKEPQYINLHLPILQFAMFFISMNLFVPYSEMVNGNQYALTFICMLTNNVFMVHMRTKTTEDIIKAYLKNAYSTFEESKYIYA